jgi:hypothetical protein
MTPVARSNLFLSPTFQRFVPVVTFWCVKFCWFFPRKCELVYKEVEEFPKNRNLVDVHLDQFKKIVSKCSNQKCCHLGLLYISETWTDSAQSSLLDWLLGRIHITMASTLVYDCLNPQHLHKYCKLYAYMNKVYPYMTYFKTAFLETT